MGYRIRTGRPLERVAPERLRAVQGTLTSRGGAVALAMTFDPGAVRNGALLAHAVDIVAGLLYVRGFTSAEQGLRAGSAADRAERWWRGPLGPAALVVEAALSPAAGCEADDLADIMRLSALAWCMVLEGVERDRPTPDLMLAAVPEGPSLASIHPEPWLDALRGSGDAVMERMRRRPDGTGCRSQTYVEMHLEGSAVEPWRLPGRSCVFASGLAPPGWRRTYVALRDTAPDPSPDTTRALLRLMLASGGDA